ncbi:MAG TPA: hypothetical protein ENK86_05510 [Campylobacterales bacterium]|nr:hypothetical protein [Campylobacterales bacterium]
MKHLLGVVLILVVISLNLLAKDGVPFVLSKPFDELRVYYKDWLVVCNDRGAGTCRMVNYVYRPENHERQSFFPDSRLSITPAQEAQEAVLDFYDRGAPSEITELSVSVDRDRFAFDSADYQTPEQNRIMETYLVTNPNKLTQVIDLSKPARWLTIKYTGSSGESHTVRFSLMGFTKALAFIERQRVK